VTPAGARVDTVVVVDLDGSTPAAASYRRAIDALCLPGIELRFSAGATALADASAADVFVGEAIDARFLAAATRLRWVSLWGAGVDDRIPSALVERRITLTNASGIHGPNIAEHVMGMMLAFTRGLLRAWRAQSEKVWRHREESRGRGPGELTGQTLGILGLGRIGEALAARARPFGMRVVGMKRDPTTRHDAAVRVDAVYGMGDIDRLLGQCDHVCNVLPYTSATHHILDAARLAQMRRGALLYNVGRGKTVDEAALVDALVTGALAGAGLDVFEHEPLSGDSPLWGMENVIITPHVAGLTPHYFERAADQLARNLARFQRGEELGNTVDVARGY
jgi:D-2-hydroxyacid dehydrogenase (NADP+)